MDAHPPSPWALRAPSRDEVEARFIGLLVGRYRRVEVDQWAAQWIAAPGEADISDERVWRGLGLLFGVDLRHSPEGDYLHDDDQIRAWLDELRR